MRGANTISIGHARCGFSSGRSLVSRAANPTPIARRRTTRQRIKRHARGCDFAGGYATSDRQAGVAEHERYSRRADGRRTWEHRHNFFRHGIARRRTQRCKRDANGNVIVPPARGNHNTAA